MRPTIGRGDEQLNRLENAIAAFRARPAAEQSRKTSLLAALERERAALLSATTRQRLGTSRLRALAREPGRAA